MPEGSSDAGPGLRVQNHLHIRPRQSLMVHKFAQHVRREQKLQLVQQSSSCGEVFRVFAENANGKSCSWIYAFPIFLHQNQLVFNSTFPPYVPESRWKGDNIRITHETIKTGRRINGGMICERRVCVRTQEDEDTQKTKRRKKARRKMRLCLFCVWQYCRLTSSEGALNRLFEQWKLCSGATAIRCICLFQPWSLCLSSPHLSLSW